MDSTVKYPAPQGNPETRHFWEQAVEGKLLIKRCTACGEPHWDPRNICPFCHSSDPVWDESKGEGAIYTFSVMRRNTPVPYAIGYVTLDEGISLLTNFVDCDFDSLEIELRRGGDSSESGDEATGDGGKKKMLRGPDARLATELGRRREVNHARGAAVDFNKAAVLLMILGLGVVGVAGFHGGFLPRSG